jgi:Flagellar protein YcgR
MRVKPAESMQGLGTGPRPGPVPERILKVGALVFLFIGAGAAERKHPTRLVGYKEGRFLLVDLPSDGGRAVPLAEGERVVLRYVLDGEVFGLRTSVRRLQYQPDPLLFLDFPTEIENVPLRTAPRVPVRLPAVVSWLPAGRPPSGLAFGFIRDLTPQGGLLEMTLPEGGKPVGRSLHLTFALGRTEEVRVNAVVQNHALDGATHRMGVAFRWTDPDERDRVVTFCELH